MGSIRSTSCKSRTWKYATATSWRGCLRPDGTHGIGGRFLRALVEQLTRRHDAPYLRRLNGFDDKNNVEVRREDHHERSYADITVGFKAERVLLVIENKVVGRHPEAEKQVKAYQPVEQGCRRPDTG